MPAESSPWIAVTDRLPTDSAHVLVCFAARGLLPRVAFFDADFGWVIGGGRTQLIPTHWMPIPDGSIALVGAAMVHGAIRR